MIVLCVSRLVLYLQSPEDFSSRLSSIDLSSLQDGARFTYSNSSRCNDECENLDWRNEGFTPEVRVYSSSVEC